MEASLPQELPQKTFHKTLQGKVVSDLMNKTITIAVVRQKMHRLYKKYVTVTKKVKAHDEKNQAKIGDTVIVREIRPISKDKKWNLVSITERAK